MDATQLLTMIRNIRKTALMSRIITPDKSLVINLGNTEYNTLAISLQFFLFLGAGITDYIGNVMYIDGGDIIVNRREDTEKKMEIDWE